MEFLVLANLLLTIFLVLKVENKKTIEKKLNSDGTTEHLKIYYNNGHLQSSTTYFNDKYYDKKEENPELIKIKNYLNNTKYGTFDRLCEYGEDYYE
ncbi:MAG: hypothetical protein WCH76_07655, partial [Candidatus Riflemargulisbacteria bacterium]